MPRPIFTNIYIYTYIYTYIYIIHIYIYIPLIINNSKKADANITTADMLFVMVMKA